MLVMKLYFSSPALVPLQDEFVSRRVGRVAQVSCKHKMSDLEDSQDYI
jgi:hypothetical protein